MENTDKLVIGGGVIKICKDISHDELVKQEVVERLKSVLSGHPTGIGLAAPQIGLDCKVFILKVGLGPNIKSVMVCRNPIITEYIGSRTVSNEGCLSFPKKFINTVRAEQIIVSYYDENNNFFSDIKLKGTIALQFQHEIDHLEGKTIFDREYKGAKAKVGRNEDCPCGSNKKYKKCCGK